MPDKMISEGQRAGLESFLSRYPVGF